MDNKNKFDVLNSPKTSDDFISLNRWIGLLMITGFRLAALPLLIPLYTISSTPGQKISTDMMYLLLIHNSRVPLRKLQNTVIPFHLILLIIIRDRTKDPKTSRTGAQASR